MVQVKLDGPAETHVRRGPVGEDGRHAFSYSTKAPGDYVISATVAGSHMQGSPAAVTASIAEAHPPLCEVVGTPLHLATIAGASSWRLQTLKLYLSDGNVTLFPVISAQLSGIFLSHTAATIA